MAKIQPDGRRQEGGPGVGGRVGDPLLEQKYIGRAQLQQGVASFQESYL